MTWSAPDVAPLLDKRLQEARLELLNDLRIHRALRHESGDTIPFIRQLVEEKLSGAAQRGFDAVEATLRVEATEALQRAGLGADALRAAVDSAAESFRRPPLPGKSASEGFPLGPNGLGVAVLTGWTVSALIWYVSGGFSWVILLLLVVLGVLVAGVCKALLLRHGAHRQERMARELPAALCRLYQRELGVAKAAYESQVNQAVRTTGAAKK